MTTKKKKTGTTNDTVRIRFADGSGVCHVAESAGAAIEYGESLDKGEVVAVENAQTDEVLWRLEENDKDNDG